MKRVAKKRLLKEEAGFTLSEMMVTMMVMLVVLFALYSIFDMSMRVFRFGNNKVEAVENARLGLERMSRELRAANPANGTDGADSDSQPDAANLFFNVPNPTTASIPSSPFDQITFGNDLNGDRQTNCPISVSDTRCEYITYKLSPDDPAAPNAPRTLRRANSNNASDAGESVVEYVTPDDSSTMTEDEGLRFTPLKADLSPLISGDGEDQIRTIRIELSIKVEGGEQDGTQTLTTDVSLRNRQDR